MAITADESALVSVRAHDRRGRRRWPADRATRSSGVPRTRSSTTCRMWTGRPATCRSARSTPRSPPTTPTSTWMPASSYSSHPADPDVSVVAFSTGDYYDERKDLATRMESSRSCAAGSDTAGCGATTSSARRAVTLWQRLSLRDLPAVGQRLELVTRAVRGDHGHSRCCGSPGSSSRPSSGWMPSGIYQVRQVVCEIAEPLLAGLHGVRADPD